jgi:hypothetical protein
VAAFTHLAAALRPGGRMTFACFRSLEQNAWATVPLAAGARLGCVAELDANPNAPGPFALADDARVRRLLEDAGLGAVHAQRVDVPLLVGRTLDEGVDYVLTFGPAARLLGEGDHERREVRRVLGEALTPYLGPSGVALGAAAWVVRAERP